MVDSVNGTNGATYRTKHYDIAANIDMGGATVDGLRSFAGVIDGRGLTISNVCFGNSNDGINLGLVSTTYSDARDTIRNLTLDHVSFGGTGTNVGAFVGNAYVNRPYLVLSNCHLGHITFPTLTASAAIGGLVGFTHNYSNSGKVVIEDSTMKDKKEYTAPLLTVVAFKTERGYAASAGTPLADFFQLFDGSDEQQTQEAWSEHSTWGSSGDSFF